MKKYLWLLLPALIFSSCDLATFMAVTNIDEVFPYAFSGNSTFRDSSVVTSRQVQDWLEEVDKSYLRELLVESVAIRLEKRPGNETEAVFLTGIGVYEGNSYEFFRDVPANINEFVDFQSISRHLKPEDMALFARLMEDFVRGTREGQVEFKFIGRTQQPDQQAELRLEVFFRFNSVVEASQSAPKFIGRK